MKLDDTRMDRPGRRELGRLLTESRSMSRDWAATFAAVDRALFLPSLMWPFSPETGTSGSVDRATDPDGWYAAADRNVPIVTQWDDGKHTGTQPGGMSSSSSSMPSVVYDLLQTLAVDEGQRVLDVGTGTGETAGALSHRCGHGRVTTIEVDATVSDQARERLVAAGRYPQVVVGDGLEGHPDGGLWDRVLATVGVREIPHAWIEQTRTGGLVVAPWGTHYSNADAVVRLAVDGQRASGHFTRQVEFMKARAQRLAHPRHADYADAGALRAARRSATSLTEADLVTGTRTAVPFVLGLRVPDCVQAEADKRDGARPVWFYGRGDRSWAVVMFRDGDREAPVWQGGPRRLWDEVEAAYRWWLAQGRPELSRFGLTVTPDGQRAWLDDPAQSWAVP